MLNFDVHNLHPLEIKLLLNFSQGEEFDSLLVQKRCGFESGHANQSFSWCLQKGFIEKISQTTNVVYELTDNGKKALKSGLVPERMFKILEAEPVLLSALPEKLGIEQSECGSAFALLKKNNAVYLDEEKCVHVFDNATLPNVVSICKELIKRAENEPVFENKLTTEELAAIKTISKKNKSDDVFKIVEKVDVKYKLTLLGIQTKAEIQKANITGEEVGELTRDMLKTGSWKGKVFREYDVENAPTAKLTSGRLNPYSQFISQVKDKLVSMGFEEFDGSLVENEFWNGDALFMPQFHPARDIHDVYYIKEPKYSKSLETEYEKYVDKVAKIHENGGESGSRGWEYKFDRTFTTRMLLRSQGTVLSAHQLAKAKIPGKYFGVVRCFRYDQVDATHGADFYQTEGIVLGDDVNLKTLLGMLKIFATEFAGAKEVKYVPGYFPFTEPSVEVHIKHPKLGWFELGGSGIFRPEVTAAFGIKCPVLAWGIGIDRMALMNLGLSDIRDLFAQNLDTVKTMKG